MPVTKATIESYVSPEDFRAVILNFEHYPEFLKEVKRVQVHERTDSSAKATFWVEIAFAGMNVKTEYTLRYTFDDVHVRWVLDSSPNLTKSEGAWTLKDNDGETVADYEAEIVTNLPIPPEIQAMFAQQELPKMLEKFRDRAEE